MNDKCIIIPAFNEANNMSETIKKIKKITSLPVIVIDDGSQDDTAHIAMNLGAYVIQHPFNMGYGAALQTGYKYALENNYRFIVQIDADGQHDPSFIPVLIKEISENGWDVIIGSRFLGEKPYNPGIIKTLGFSIFRKIIQLTCQKTITDPTSGFQALNKKAITLFCKDSFPTDYPDANIIIMIHRLGFQILEVPVSMHNAPNNQGMHQGFLTIVYYVFKMLLSILVILLRDMDKGTRTKEISK